jgi:WD40 repeat protein
MYCNENILKLIITNFTLLKQLFDKINNKQLAAFILGKLDYQKIFKSLGESKIILGEHTGWIMDLTLLPNNKLASASRGQKLDFWDLNEYKCLKTLKDDCDITSVATLPELKMAICTFMRIRIFSINKFECIKTLDLNEYKDFRNLLLLPDKTLACCAYLWENDQILIFDCNNDYSLIKQITLLTKVHRLINLSNNRFATSSKDSIIRIWDIKGCHCIQELALPRGSGLTALVFVERDNLLLSGLCDDNFIKVWSLETYQCVKNVEIKIRGISSFLVLPNRYLACGSFLNGKIMILDLCNYECINIFDEGNSSIVHSLKLLDDKRIISTSSKITIWNY